MLSYLDLHVSISNLVLDNFFFVCAMTGMSLCGKLQVHLYKNILKCTNSCCIQQTKKNVKTSSCVSLPVPMENNIDTSTSMQGLLKIFLTSKRVDMGASTSCSTCISNSASSLAREDWHSPAPSSTLLYQERHKKNNKQT